MLDVSIVNETSPEANWNGQTDRQADGQTGKPICREAAPPKSVGPALCATLNLLICFI